MGRPGASWDFLGHLSFKSRFVVYKDFNLVAGVSLVACRTAERWAVAPPGQVAGRGATPELPLELPPELPLRGGPGATPARGGGLGGPTRR
jgi:hypothetical protein